MHSGNMSSSSSSTTKRRNMMMMIQDRRIDRLSALPDDILHHILSFLDTKFSVETCILSKRWTSVWKYVHVLTFNGYSFCSDRSFEQHTDRVLSLRSDSSSINRIEASLVMDSPEGLRMSDRIGKYAASHGVRELFIEPHCFSFLDAFGLVQLCFPSLKVLEVFLTNFEDAYHELQSCLQVLDSLTLTGCVINKGHFANLFELKSLKLDDCVCGYEGDPFLKVTTASKLLNLEITFWGGINNIEIVAPQLQCFTLNFDILCSMKQVSKSNLPSLDRANIQLVGYKRGSTCCNTTCCCKNDAHKQQAALEHCVNLFKILHNVQVLNLEVETFELLIQICKSSKYQSCSPFRRMKSMNVKCPEKSLKRVPNRVVRYFLGGFHKEEGKTFTVNK